MSATRPVVSPSADRSIWLFVGLLCPGEWKREGDEDDDQMNGTRTTHRLMSNDDGFQSLSLGAWISWRWWSCRRFGHGQAANFGRVNGGECWTGDDLMMKPWRRMGSLQFPVACRPRSRWSAARRPTFLGCGLGNFFGEKKIAIRETTHINTRKELKVFRPGPFVRLGRGIRYVESMI
jgi:hypothetical protein